MGKVKEKQKEMIFQAGRKIWAKTKIHESRHGLGKRKKSILILGVEEDT